MIPIERSEASAEVSIRGLYKASYTRFLYEVSICFLYKVSIRGFYTFLIQGFYIFLYEVSNIAKSGTVARHQKQQHSNSKACGLDSSMSLCY